MLEDEKREDERKEELECMLRLDLVEVDNGHINGVVLTKDSTLSTLRFRFCFVLS